MAASNEQFFESISTYAAKASQKTGIPASVIMAQVALESAFGKSSLAQRANNLGGIKYSKNSIAQGQTGELKYASYSGYAQFFQDYVRVMKLGYYDAVRAAGSVEGAIKALAASPYAESGYSGGKGLADIIDRYNLTTYDGSSEKKNSCQCSKCKSNPCRMKAAVHQGLTMEEYLRQVRQV